MAKIEKYSTLGTVGTHSGEGPLGARYEFWGREDTASLQIEKCQCRGLATAGTVGIPSGDGTLGGRYEFWGREDTASLQIEKCQCRGHSTLGSLGHSQREGVARRSARILGEARTPLHSKSRTVTAGATPRSGVEATSSGDGGARRSLQVPGE